MKQIEHRRRGRLHTLLIFHGQPWSEAALVSSEGLLWLLRIPRVRLSRAVVAAPSLSLCSRDFGARSEGQRHFVLHNGFFVRDGLGLFCCSVD